MSSLNKQSHMKVLSLFARRLCLDSKSQHPRTGKSGTNSKTNKNKCGQHFFPDSGTECKVLAIKKLRRHTGEGLEQFKSRWPRDIKRRFTAARFLGLRVRNPSGAWIFVCCECCVLSGRGLCEGLITRPEESYRVWSVWMRSRSLENEEDLNHQGLRLHGKN